MTSTSNKFPRAKRLLKRAEFQRVYQNGRRRFTGNMTVFYLRRSDAAGAVIGKRDQPRIGFTVGKALGGAIERNRIRRRMREAVRTLWHQVEGPVDVVFNPRRSVLNLPYPTLVGEVERGLRFASQRVGVAPALAQPRRNDEQ